MNKKISVSLVITIVLIAMTVTFSATMMTARQLFNSQMADVTEKEQMYDKLAELDKTVRSNFYAGINDQTLLDTMSTGYVAGLTDKNSKYYTAKQMAVLADTHAGKLMGVGVEIAKDPSGYFKVVKVYPGSPAHTAGIAKNTMLTRVNGVDLTGYTVDGVNSLLAGEAGTIVSLTYLADASETAVELQRKSYDSPTVEYQLEGENGYIRIRTFASGTAAELEQAIGRLTEQGAKALIFDLRDNAGGLLEYAAECVDLVCPAGTIASGVYKDEVSRVLYTSDAAQAALPCVAVTNANTAYGAELFAVSVRDFGMGRIVGARTAGKGTVQELFTMKDGSGVELTVASLLPGRSESFDGVGVLPDYERVLTSEEELGYYDFTLQTDPQLARAFETAATLVKSGAVQMPEPEPTEAPAESAPAESEPAESESASEADPAAEAEDSSIAESEAA